MNKKPPNHFSKLFVCALGGGVFTALAFALSADGTLNFHTLLLPSVLLIAAIVGASFGVLVSPSIIWALRNKQLRVAVPTIYGFAAIVTVILNLLQIRHSMYVSFALTSGMICLYKFVGK